jgi:hypothetical protein
MRNKNIFKLILFVSILALAGLSCGVSDIGKLFATETPTPTSTYTPTTTFTPSPTSTSTPTRTPTATPMPESFLEKLADGSTRFTDFKGGYTFILPDGWMVINFAVDDPVQALEDAKAANPDKVVILTGLQTAINQNARMGAADFAPDHFIATSAPLLFNILDNATQFMPLSDILDANKEVIPQLLKAEVKDSGLLENALGVQYGFIDISLNLTVSDTNASIFEKLIVFKTDDYTVYFTFAVLDMLKEGGLQGVEKFVDSIDLVP